MSFDRPWMIEPFIATTIEEILSAAQSKYTISSVNEMGIVSDFEIWFCDGWVEGD